MEQRENPLRPAYWLGGTDARPLAIFRIGLGLCLLQDLLDYWGNLRAFASDDGMLPRGVQGDATAWSLFNLSGDPLWVAVLFLAGVAAVVAFTIGYRTRLATALAWLFMTSLHTRNLYVTDGGDDLVRILLFTSMFTDLGGAFSLDVACGRKQPDTPVPALGLRFLQWHVALLYFVAARLKFRAGWLHSDVIFQTLQLTGFTRPPGQALLNHPSLCRSLGVATILLEGSFAFLALSPWRVTRARSLAILANFAVQGGILLTMRVGIFTQAMLSASALFLLPAHLEPLFGRLHARLENEFRTRRPALRLAAFAALGLHFVGLAWGPFIGRRVPQPSLLQAERRWLWLDQPFGLFDVVYDVPRWEAQGRVGGTEVSVLPSSEPGLLPVLGWRFSRWYKFTFKERERSFKLPQLAAWLCRSYGEHAGPRLETLTLVETLTPPLVPGGRPQKTQRRTLWEGDCTRAVAGLESTGSER